MATNAYSNPPVTIDETNFNMQFADAVAFTIDGALDGLGGFDDLRAAEDLDTRADVLAAAVSCQVSQFSWYGMPGPAAPWTPYQSFTWLPSYGECGAFIYDIAGSGDETSSAANTPATGGFAIHETINCVSYD